MIPLERGSVKEARYFFSLTMDPYVKFLTLGYRFILNAMHMGEPAIGPIILKWIEDLFGVDHLPKMNGYA